MIELDEVAFDRPDRNNNDDKQHEPGKERALKRLKNSSHVICPRFEY